ncbi:probable serine/threonine-protein kinase PBL28 [Andrographis paniculata]|uniref:probable serine/threonine-protein kinase PBL28 n=1 Tax=Andrographis paniculata TaxID=175694 RepID=UPI0021E817C3|nr:probable serine/threonine-protein kinase PBL28 [Andrographis paniculata]
MEGGCLKFTLTFLFLTTLLCAGVLSFPSPEDPGSCILNFTSYPYRPIGGCRNVQENLKDWNGLPKTSCCQNALIVFSHALALHATANSAGNIFISQDQWNSCSGPFRRQPNVSIQTCGFDSFYYGSSPCSTLTLSSINDEDFDEQCSKFSTSPFDAACGSCTSALSAKMNQISTLLEVDASNRTEKAACLLGLIVLFIARKRNDTSESDDFIRCLSALAVPESKNYIRLPSGAAEALLAVILVMIALAAVITLIKYVTKNQKKKKKSALSKSIEDTCSGLYRFSKVEIENAINYGNEKKYLGRGSAGQVYKGMLPSGQLVAIKQLYKNNTSDSFTREIDGLSRVRHPNLVCLFGCCIDDGEQYLVYEYCSKGNLAQHLLRKDTSLTWEMRVKILRDCASGLKYLHSHIDGCIVHRDIKLTNILLTHSMEPKLSDFGLAKMLGMEESKVFTDVRGTIGYMDPEYMSNAKLTCASDIYSFGIVTLQLLSGQRVIELDLDARDQLTRKAKDVNMGKRPLTDFQDPKMKGNVVSVDFESILQIAVLCVASSSTGRPTIDLVYEELEKAWKNTRLEMKARQEKNMLEATPSKSQEIIQA